MTVAMDQSQERSYSTMSYVRSGLVAMWDGIENTGTEMRHDFSAQVWKDLVGNRDFIVKAGEWDNDCLVQNSYEILAQRIDDLPNSIDKFFECVFAITDVRNVGTYSPCRIFIIANGFCSGKLFYSPGNLYVPYGGNGIAVNPALGKPFSVSVDNIAAADTSGVRWFMNGVRHERDGIISNWGGDAMQLGARDPANDHAVYGKIKMYCLRVYDRPLTEQEVERNFAIDKRRFGT